MAATLLEIDRAPSSPVKIQRLTQPTLLPFRRTLSLLLPVRYPDNFFAETLTDSTTSSLSRVAIWCGDDTITEELKKIENVAFHRDSEVSIKEEVNKRGIVIGGIRCRLEALPCSSSEDGKRISQQLYIQALALLSPYRGQGIATLLLNEIIKEVQHNHQSVSSMYAHVWEANTEGHEWYQRRGFTVDEELLEGYYNRLRPGGARIVRRNICSTEILENKEQSFNDS